MPPTSRSLLGFAKCPSASSAGRTLTKHHNIQRPNVSTLAAFKVPDITNEPNKHYAKGSTDRQALADAVKALQQRVPLEIPLVISGNSTKTDSTATQNNPASHSTPVAKYSKASPEDVKTAIESALAAKEAWSSLPFADRCAVFLKAADLLSTKYRYDMMAVTMLGQGKNAWQAEIDAAAELADFLRFNVRYAEELYAQQPPYNSAGVWNRLEYRPLEGFVYAVSPFNFTAIGGNLPGAPALLGNVVLWKPSDSAIASNYLVHQILLEAGLPEGVIQFVPGDPVEVTNVVLAHPEFAALHYTGSTAVFRKLYGQIGQGIAEGRYKGYPRIVGETGGKNFHLVHNSADLDNAVYQTVRGAFEYQGQKCSACSRLYIPASLADKFKSKLVEETKKLKIGAPEEFGNFIGPVIHEPSFKKLSGVIDAAKDDSNLTLLTGGKYDSSQGWFVHPTIYETKDPHHKNMKTEFFGPILHLYVYDDSTESAFEDVCKLVDTTVEYGLTGAVFARDRTAIRSAEEALRHSAGNFYVNGKCTGAVVGQQPFGGARSSGTNDKAGSFALLSRFVSMRAVKEDLLPIDKVIYPSNDI
ncbi:1-pyrroline-5-carboxylate dehydrogenase [Lithohypha guttulata]|uniref:Multifunctional fusion protein n=1 Tax=Lithohypha guttulata TaxID=1690604 RepID=A0AAN7TEA5_9EURO|nr:1-pyrroline-5-carboxylate dehydrogenase [Lithohypha guttulata]KAK5091001.1 1-pyrroline-5-carboxylate dehydrogenase [Lithohypha guttulata]KAK5104202.1 1-pyrroline-5-carboxylate dehydrogenase [Lithohypha guttulata]